ncbi:MAG: helix-turn-helix domain-containing protein [Nostoc sp.]|uniref:helix-turn-helix transcriptional regulator n=1 Tax=Nostoc sp. TaxID=1180 RepID=UPI002FFCAF65
MLEDRDWTQVQLAERLGYTTKHISLLINGKAPINEKTALKLERVLGTGLTQLSQAMVRLRRTERQTTRQ